MDDESKKKDDEGKKNLRVTLGPDLSRHISETLPDESGATLDKEFRSLLAARDRTVILEAERTANQQTISSLLNRIGELCSALTDTSSSVSKLSDMIDHRTREIITIFVHISTLVGTKFAEGDEVERLHRRFKELNTDLERQMEGLSSIVKEQQVSREKTVQSIVGRAEEERLSIAEQQEALTLQRNDRTKGYER